MGPEIRAQVRQQEHMVDTHARQEVRDAPLHQVPIEELHQPVRRPLPGLGFHLAQPRVGLYLELVRDHHNEGARSQGAYFLVEGDEQVLGREPRFFPRITRRMFAEDLEVFLQELARGEPLARRHVRHVADQRAALGVALVGQLPGFVELEDPRVPQNTAPWKRVASRPAPIRRDGEVGSEDVTGADRRCPRQLDRVVDEIVGEKAVEHHGIGLDARAMAT